MPRKKIDTPLPPLTPRAASRTPAAPAAEKPRYTVIRDTREKAGQGWWFPGSTACKGTVERKLDTGDYSVEGLEHLVTIDRKGAISEFATNLFDARFERELGRMAAFELAVVLLEFDFGDIQDWPASSSIPKHRWKYLKVTKSSFLKRFWEVQLRHPSVHFLFAGFHGKEAASSLFKRVTEKHAIRP